MHLIVLGKLAQGKESFDGFTALAHHPLIVAGEVLVVFAVMLHGINGLRIALTGIGYNVGSQKRMLVVIFVVAIVIGLYFAIRMFGGAE